jgi:hypothetical protein
MNAAEMAAIGEAEDTFIKFEGDINVDAVFSLVGTPQKLPGIPKPQELSIELEMQGQQATVQNKQHIFAFAVHGANATALR